MNKENYHLSISRESSNAIKGLLMLLIVFGHVGFLNNVYSGCQPQNNGRYFHWFLLYSFHVYCFFILPFVYNKNPYQKGDLLKNGLKLLYPFLWIGLICLAISIFLGGGGKFCSITKLIQTFYSGNEYLIKENLGFSFPWFLPLMFSLLILKSLYYLNKKTIKIILIALSALAWIYSIIYGKVNTPLQNYLPLAIVQALRVLGVCLLTVFVLERWAEKTFVKISSVILFIGLGILYYCQFYYKVEINMVWLYFLMPLTAFLVIWSLKDILAKSRLLQAIGKLSLQIYLYHVIIINILSLLITKRHCPPTILDGVLVYVLALVIAYLLALLTTKVGFLRKILYPKPKTSII